MMRFFIAIEFDENILQALTNLQSEWKVLGVRGNYTTVQNLHLTLAFIGEYGNPNAVLEAMNPISFAPFIGREFLKTMLCQIMFADCAELCLKTLFHTTGKNFLHI